VEAVKKWYWKPLKLNGVAVEAETTITVNFEPR
jgi:outer membrane biosynthesis protein TonB